ncbi:tRNA pseudouridine(38/39) synthase [Galdieria sulphuraria]|uniref:tRNA pseudouridine synthase n=1 Tax=Galdieria sulphuraria TaxID=130081 RepID=M2Y7P4_GALSU|nr:tRNA pseudouridine synthase A [Galdieria sulphuraria]EME32098.1 tRNA pseudouridine synthase A [Galdieria sulphuraria]GJD06665.1 tRNA pseudouridine(38/39) synthase [Galdieria sulphuraria]|eukprot:XP_005708618.1 tRNA pseudouridine synthase A [Galdieria sulphuraria]
MEQLENQLIQTSEESLQSSSKEELIHFILSLRDAFIKNKDNSSNSVSASLCCATTGKPFDFNKHGKRKIALRICYLGWRFDGFASQPHSDNTVEEHLFRALLKTKLIENREGSCYSRAARTDKGVSAIENVVSLTVRSHIIPPSNGEVELDYPRILNGVLPSGIWITGWTSVDPDFHARFSASYRVYHYYFRPEHLNLSAMQRAAQFFVGEHDFRNFCKADVTQVQSFRRVIYSCDIKIVSMTHKSRFEWHLPPESATCSLQSSKNTSSICLAKLVVKGQAFLWHQIRCMASILFMVGEGLEKEDIVKDMLQHECFGAKPLYRMASEIPLVLSQIGFGGLSFQISSKAYTDVEKFLQEACTSLLCKAAILKDLLNSLHEHFIRGENLHQLTEPTSAYLLDREQGPHRLLESRKREASIDARRERQRAKNSSIS